MLWFVVTCSNNYPDNIESYYPDAVEQYGGCPVKLDTDLGTENGTMAAIQAFFFRDDEHSHHFVSSPRNQRIEGYWSFYRRNNSTWWIFFSRSDSSKPPEH